MNVNHHLINATACIKTSDPNKTIIGKVEDALPADQLPVTTSIGNGLFAVYLMDEGDHFSYVQHDHLDVYKADPKGMHEIGLMNLSKLAQKNLRIVPHGAIHGLLLDGQFEASLIMLDDLWDDTLASYTPNGAIVALPTRSHEGQVLQRCIN